MRNRAGSLLLSISAITGLAHRAAAGEWQFVGRSSVSPGRVMCCEIAADPLGVIHVAYQDQSIGVNPATVVKRSGDGWSFVGAQGGASIRQAWYDHLAFDTTGAPLLACRDYGVDGKINVRRFDTGGGWRDVGEPGASPGEAHYTDIATGRDGVPFIVFADRTTSPPDRATVMRFASGEWLHVGNPGISDAEAQYTSLALDGNDVPYVAFTDRSRLDGAQVGRISVKRYDPITHTWSYVGPPGFSPTGGIHGRIAFDRTGAPCVAYHQYHSAIRVMRFDGSQWNPIGGSASGTDRPSVETESWRQWTSLAFDSQNVPYVAYQRLDFENRAAVRSFDGMHWTPVGELGFTPANADYLAMTVDPFDVPWIVFRDNGDGQRAAVMRFSSSSSTYCAATTDRLGCSPHISLDDSLAGDGPGVGMIRATGVLSRRSGLLVYSRRPARLPFAGGTLCVAPPFRVIEKLNSGGSLSGHDCTGALSVDFDAWIESGIDPDLVPGRTVYAQFWYRDPFTDSGAGSTDAIRFVIGL